MTERSKEKEEGRTYERKGERREGEREIGREEIYI